MQEAEQPMTAVLNAEIAQRHREAVSVD